jgi:hypothetical protein
VDDALLVHVGEGLAELPEDAEHLVASELLLAVGLPPGYVVRCLGVEQERSAVVEELIVLGNAQNVRVLKFGIFLGDLDRFLALLFVEGRDVDAGY